MQVINDFGPLSNTELLRRYGFVECTDNPHDCVEFSVEDVVQVSNLHSHLHGPEYVPIPLSSCTHERCAYCVCVPGLPEHQSRAILCRDVLVKAPTMP